MTQGLIFLICMAIEGVVAAFLGACVNRRLELSRFGASVRAGAAAVIGTGATHPVIWLEYTRLAEWVGNRCGAIVLGAAGAILIETLFYAAVFRGHWRWSAALSTLANMAAFGTGFFLTSWLPRSG